MSLIVVNHIILGEEQAAGDEAWAPQELDQLAGLNVLPLKSQLSIVP